VSFIIRAALLTLFLVPYLYFGISDVLHHKHYRKVSFTERLLHVTLGIALTIIISHAYAGHFEVVVVGFLLFVAARALDEFVFHRGLPDAEIDLHAKTHFGFLIFVVGVIGANWLETHHLLQ
jgi:hypothetical protein